MMIPSIWWMMFPNGHIPPLQSQKADCKLKIKRTYNLLNQNTVHVSATNADGNALSYSITRIEFPDGTVKEKEDCRIICIQRVQ
ncbi:MAG: hypothetical protein ACLTX3_07640 [Lachnospiraceae bacterium]